MRLGSIVWRIPKRGGPAAMIAAAGTVKLQAGERSDWDLNADVMLRLQNIEVEDEELRKHVRYRL